LEEAKRKRSSKRDERSWPDAAGTVIWTQHRMMCHRCLCKLMTIDLESDRYEQLRWHGFTRFQLANIKYNLVGMNFIDIIDFSTNKWSEVAYHSTHGYSPHEQRNSPPTFIEWHNNVLAIYTSPCFLDIDENLHCLVDLLMLGSRFHHIAHLTC
jgi:hypothetical protein